jgi:DNA-binding FadR family transcriptional regulator
VTADYAASIADVDRCIELDVAFHQELALIADSPILASLVATLAALAFQGRVHTAHNDQARETALAEHITIAKAVAASDPAAARAAMASHLGRLQKRIALDLAAGPSEAR